MNETSPEYKLFFIALNTLCSSQRRGALETHLFSKNLVLMIKNCFQCVVSILSYANNVLIPGSVRKNFS